MIRSYSSLLFWLGMTIAASVMLYHTSDRVNALDQHLRKLNAQIEDEQKDLHVLKAEWVYLANPVRIEAEAKRHLSLQPTMPSRVASMKNMGDLLPPQNGNDAPVQIAQSVKPPSSNGPPSLAEAKRDKPRNDHDRVLASLNAGRINDHMTMQHTAAAVVQPDRIGVLIGKLGLRP